MLTSTGFVNGRWQFSIPTDSTPLDRSPKKIVASYYVGDPYGCAKFGANPFTGGFWANGWNITKFLFIYWFIPFFHELTYRSDATTDLHAQTTRTRARMCLLGVSLTLLPILVVKYPKNNFGGVNRRFQAKRAKYWKFYVIETNTSISTKSCTAIDTIKNSSWVVPIGAQQIQDGGRPPFWKKTFKSLYLCNRLTDFDKIW